MSETLKASFGPDFETIEVGKIKMLATEEAMPLDGGESISNFPIAYQTHGTLNADKSNAILIFHGLTGDQYIVGPHPVTGKNGWWESLVGPGEIFDTDRFFIISCNTIGSCMGSWGPKSINPETNEPYGTSFPVITIGDMVRAQALFIESCGIEKLFAVVGGSMGGMFALEWAVRYGERTNAVVALATAARHSAQNIAFHEIGRQAIIADPAWNEGHYIKKGTYPAKGLAIGRMMAHITYLSDSALHRKFGRGLQNREEITYGFDADFQVESYLRHQGFTFVERFDPNSYLYITRALDYFDLVSEFDGDLSKAFEGSTNNFCIMSFSSDWLFPTSESKRIVHALNATSAHVSFVEIESDKGHDAFLLDEPEFHHTLRGFLHSAAQECGLMEEVMT